MCFFPQRTASVDVDAPTPVLGAASMEVAYRPVLRLRMRWRPETKLRLNNLARPSVQGRPGILSYTSGVDGRQSHRSRDRRHLCHRGPRTEKNTCSYGIGRSAVQCGQTADVTMATMVKALKPLDRDGADKSSTNANPARCNPTVPLQWSRRQSVKRRPGA